MSLQEIVLNLVRCPYSKFFCERTDVVTPQIANIRHGKLMMNKLIVSWTAFHPMSIVEEASQESCSESERSLDENQRDEEYFADGD